MKYIYKHKITGIQAKLAEDGKYYIHNCSIGIPKQLIENHTHWLKEDGYEILTFKSDRLSFYMPAIQKDGTYLDNPIMSCDGGGATLDWMLKEPEYNIHSVKRLNDNGVFNIGDKYVAYNGSIGGSISEFRLVRGEIYINCVNIPLNDIQKVGEPLFKTQDGVELFGGESIYGVTDDFQLCYTSIATKENVKGVRIFAKKENAETFIKENKPQYSLNDIRNVLTKQMECTNWVMIDVDNIIKDLEK